MTRDEAIELMARAINKAAGLPESDVDCWNEHATASIDALIAAGWTGPWDLKMPRQLPMPEYKFQKEEHGSMQTNYHKVGPVYTIDDVKDGRAEWQDKENARIEKIDLGSPKAIRYSLDDLNTARSLARNAALEEAADLAHSYGGVGEAFISAAILELKVDFPATKTVI